MNKGIKTVIYPVKDVTQAKTLFRKLLGVEPYADQPYYVGFKIGDQDIGLIPNGHNAGMTAFYHVDDIKANLQILLDAGARNHSRHKRCRRRKINCKCKRQGR